MKAKELKVGDVFYHGSDSSIRFKVVSLLHPQYPDHLLVDGTAGGSYKTAYTADVTLFREEVAEHIPDKFPEYLYRLFPSPAAAETWLNGIVYDGYELIKMGALNPQGTTIEVLVMKY